MSEEKIVFQMVKGPLFSMAFTIIAVSMAALLFWDVYRSNEISLAKAIPSGVVMAFDLAEGCPVGWIEFNRAKGKFLMGAGKEALFAQSGGYRKVTLSVENLPEHNHGMEGLVLSGNPQIYIKQALRTEEARLGIRTNTNEKQGVGAGKPISTLPPYTVLYFCKKQ